MRLLGQLFSNSIAVRITVEDSNEYPISSLGLGFGISYKII